MFKKLIIYISVRYRFWSCPKGFLDFASGYLREKKLTKHNITLAVYAWNNGRETFEAPDKLVDNPEDWHERQGLYHTTYIHKDFIHPRHRA